MVEADDIGAVGNRGVRNPERGRQVPDLVDGLAFHPRVEVIGLLVGLLRDGQRRVLVDPVLVSGHRAQVEPLLGRAATDVDKPVLRAGDPGHGQSPGVAPRPAQHLVVGHRIVGEAEDLGLQHRDVDEFRAASQPRGQRRRTGVRAGQVLADLSADVHRRAVGRTAAEADDATRPRLQRELCRGTVTPRAVQTERRDRRDREMWMCGQNRGGREHHVVGDARSA